MRPRPNLLANHHLAVDRLRFSLIRAAPASLPLSKVRARLKMNSFSHWKFPARANNSPTGGTEHAFTCRYKMRFACPRLAARADLWINQSCFSCPVTKASANWSGAFSQALISQWAHASESIRCS